ncbi:TetR/AcrR family transcriptional regulator [uncultured Winogradskyella sp.]|uniref:TetR/AcrR family transcriptional regulator n=1 Tax=uncultured Winogradskyella sp. TaxID=395353 RepID=UPI00260CE87D|nr:TetR/AcrR family transcriptional regulator [uncultured Winogradskyella sp.]
MQKTLKRDIKIDTLLDKGIELLWSKGYNATSVNDIVKIAGIPKGSFYFYFESKEDFAVKAIEKYFDDHFTPAKNILLNKSLSPKQRLLDFHEFRYNILKNEMDCKLGCMACNLGNEMAEHSELIRTSILNKEQYILSLITEAIQEAQGAGEIKNIMPAKDIAAFIEDAGKGSMTTMKEMNNSYPIDNFMNIVRNILLK